MLPGKLPHQSSHTKIDASECHIKHLNPTLTLMILCCFLLGFSMFFGGFGLQRKTRAPSWQLPPSWRSSSATPCRGPIIKAVPVSMATSRTVEEMLSSRFFVLVVKYIHQKNDGDPDLG